MNSEALRVGLVGCGHWGQHILRDLRDIGADVSVVATSSNTKQRAKEGGAARIVPRVNDLEGVAGVVVATPVTTHAEVIHQALDLGVPVFCEKPLTADLSEAEALLARAPDSVFVMDKWRYHPGIDALGEIARSGELGAVIGLSTVRVAWGEGRSEVDTTWHLAPHDLSIALEILGTIPPVISARVEKVAGVVTGIHALLGTDPWLALTVSSACFDRQRLVRLHCEHGVAWLGDAYADAIGVATTAGDEPEWRNIGTDMPLRRELEAFVDHLRGGPRPQTSLHDAATIVRRITEMRDSAGL